MVSAAPEVPVGPRWCTRCLTHTTHPTAEHDQAQVEQAEWASRALAGLATSAGDLVPSVAWLTPAEHDLVDKIGSLMGDFAAVMGEAATRRNDTFEVMLHVHGLQNMVLAQAAMRAYPGTYRGLGTTVRGREPEAGS